jgi:hypothetical protein
MSLDYLNQNFYFGGYYIIKPTTRSDWMNEDVLHEIILSASRCICDFFPDIDVVWSKSKKKKEEYMKTLGLDSHTYNEMELWINKEFEYNFDFPDVFNSYESAVEFCHKFLYSQNDLRVIGVALPKIHRDAFLEEQDDLRYGICKNLNKSLSIDSNITILGYEILGYEYGGFHSYICNGLEDDYYDKYNFKLNKNGLISTMEEAQILSDYTNEVIEGTEPVLWLPWIILDIPYNR